MATVRFENVVKRYPNGFETVTDLDLDIEHGELFVVAGPSGCGKSTTLRMLAGHEDVSEGKIWIGDRCVNDVGARNRNIATVFQRHALFPHLTVAGNLAYPLEVAGMDRNEREQRVRDVASTLGLTALLDRTPRMLSGAQRQRVAMGRAMVRRPAVFVMSEPLSNLDARLRVTMRAEVSELQRKLQATMFYVTHDPVEAMTMGDRVAIMRLGVLQQVASPTELVHEPANVFVAGFIGSPPMNRIRATMRTSGDGTRAASGATDITPLFADLDSIVAVAGHGEFTLGVRPEHLSLTSAGEGLPARVRLVEQLGSERILHVDVDGIRLLRPEDRRELDDDGSTHRLLVNVRDDTVMIRPGDAIHLTVDGRHVHIFDGVTGDRVSP